MRDAFCPFLREAMEKKHPTSRMMVLLLVFTVLAVYYPALFAPLCSLDDPGLYERLLNEEGISLRRIFVPGANGTYYRPLLDVSFLGDRFLWGLEESFMHLENILFHLIATLLVFAVARRVARRLNAVSPWPPFLAGLFFAVHPINTEAVMWISARTDLLACIFILLSMFLLLASKRSLVTTCASALCLFAACLAKDSAIFFLPAALVFPFFNLDETAADNNLSAIFQTLRDNLPHFFVFVLSGGAYFLFRSLAFARGDLGARQIMTDIVVSPSGDALNKGWIILKTIGFYVKKMFVPFPLNFAIVHVSDWYIILALVFLVLLTALLVRRTLIGFFFVAAAFVGASALLPPLLRMTWTPLAERYMYIPSAFFLIGLLIAIERPLRFTPVRRIAIFAMPCLVAVCIYGSASRGILWQDNLALFEDCVRKSPGFVPALNQVASAHYALGNAEEAYRIIKSIEMPENLINSQRLQFNKAVVMIAEGDTEGARVMLRELLQNPGKFEGMIIESLLQLNALDVQEGAVEKKVFYEENTRILSRLYEITGDPFCFYRLGRMHLSMGERSKAADSFEQVVAKAPPEVYYYKPAQKLLGKLSKKQERK